ncbi:hypothetical protein GDO81_020788 [Engystomops pustulosus]|uniref:Uncharacterized protein n=1 Tax=Engystomops pustulosus TaxID=76066 RepID=A0AAV6Z921_ENGPU|nr:hypothetical protein GDO81_020788 [Engystomops pustulosus]
MSGQSQQGHHPQNIRSPTPQREGVTEHSAPGTGCRHWAPAGSGRPGAPGLRGDSSEHQIHFCWVGRHSTWCQDPMRGEGTAARLWG